MLLRRSTGRPTTLSIDVIGLLGLPHGESRCGQNLTSMFETRFLLGDVVLDSPGRRRHANPQHSDLASFSSQAVWNSSSASATLRLMPARQTAAKWSKRSELSLI